MSFPFACFITWTCYGTRLHGDEQGSVDRDHNTFGTPLLAPSPERERLERSQMTHAPFVLDALRRPIVHDTIVKHIAYRGWTLHALHVRTTHVHVVVSARIEPETIMGQLKSWSSRRLREAGLALEDAKIWTPHGSTKYLWEGVGLAAAKRYVLEMQGAPLD